MIIFSTVQNAKILQYRISKLKLPKYVPQEKLSNTAIWQTPMSPIKEETINSAKPTMINYDQGKLKQRGIFAHLIIQ